MTMLDRLGQQADRYLQKIKTVANRIFQSATFDFRIKMLSTGLVVISPKLS